METHSVEYVGMVKEILDQRWYSSNVVKILHVILSGRFQVRKVGSTLGNRLEIINC